MKKYFSLLILMTGLFSACSQSGSGDNLSGSGTVNSASGQLISQEFLTFKNCPKPDDKLLSDKFIFESEKNHKYTFSTTINLNQVKKIFKKLQPVAEKDLGSSLRDIYQITLDKYLVYIIKKEGEPLKIIYQCR